MSKFEGLISLKEAGKLFNKEESTLRRNISNGKFIEGTDVKKFGTTWVFDIKALEREYGTNILLKFENLNIVRKDDGKYIKYTVNNEYDVMVDINNDIVNYIGLNEEHSKGFLKIYDRVQNIIDKFCIFDYLNRLNIDIAKLENVEMSKLIKLSKENKQIKI